MALDVGAGSLNSTRHLLAAGFRVRAVDPDPYTAELAADIDDARLDMRCADIQSLPVDEGAFELVVAIHVLHLLPRDDLTAVVPTLLAGLAPGGVLCATFVGVRDTWAATPWRATAVRRDEVLTLVGDTTVIRLDEREYDGANVLGQSKHWHVVRCIVRNDVR